MAGWIVAFWHCVDHLWSLRSLQKYVLLDFRLSSDTGFHEAVYLGLLNLREGERTMAQSAVDIARGAITQGLVTAGSGLCCRGLYPTLSKLQCVQLLQHAM